MTDYKLSPDYTTWCVCGHRRMAHSVNDAGHHGPCLGFIPLHPGQSADADECACQEFEHEPAFDGSEVPA